MVLPDCHRTVSVASLLLVNHTQCMADFMGNLKLMCPAIRRKADLLSRALRKIWNVHPANVGVPTLA